MSILALWLKRGFVSTTGGASTLITEVITDAGAYVVTDNDEIVVLG